MNKEIPVEKNKIYTINIHGLGHRGEGVGRYNDFTIFVDQAIPGLDRNENNKGEE